MKGPLMEATEMTIAAPRLVPYDQNVHVSACPACGYQAPPGLMTRVLAAVKGVRIASNNVRYCAGGKEPTEKVSPLPIPGFERDIPNTCLGVMEPHLHVTCGGCGYERFMGLRVHSR